MPRVNDMISILGEDIRVNTPNRDLNDFSRFTPENILSLVRLSMHNPIQDHITQEFYMESPSYETYFKRDYYFRWDFSDKKKGVELMEIE